MYEKMKLNDDPKEALKEISGYLKCVDTSIGRRVSEDGEVIGYYQLTAYIDGLLEIAEECDRIIKPRDRHEPNPTDMFAS